MPQRRPYLPRVCEYTAAVGLGQGCVIFREAVLPIRGVRRNKSKKTRKKDSETRADKNPRFATQGPPLILAFCAQCPLPVLPLGLEARLGGKLRSSALFDRPFYLFLSSFVGFYIFDGLSRCIRLLSRLKRAEGSTVLMKSNSISP